MIFKRVGIDTQEVLEAAGSAWAVLSFRMISCGGLATR